MNLKSLQLVHVGPEEEKFALNAIFARHPVMKTWPKDHGEFPNIYESQFFIFTTF